MSLLVINLSTCGYIIAFLPVCQENFSSFKRHLFMKQTEKKTDTSVLKEMSVFSCFILSNLLIRYTGNGRRFMQSQS